MGSIVPTNAEVSADLADDLDVIANRIRGRIKDITSNIILTGRNLLAVKAKPPGIARGGGAVS